MSKVCVVLTVDTPNDIRTFVFTDTKKLEAFVAKATKTSTMLDFDRNVLVDPSPDALDTLGRDD